MCRYIFTTFPRILQGGAVDETPYKLVEASKCGLYLEKASGIGDSRFNFSAVAHNCRISNQFVDSVFIERSDFVRIETGECLSVASTFVQYGRPGQSRLRAFQNKKLEQAAFLMHGDAPFTVVVNTAGGVPRHHPLAAWRLGSGARIRRHEPDRGRSLRPRITTRSRWILLMLTRWLKAEHLHRRPVFASSRKCRRPARTGCRSADDGARLSSTPAARPRPSDRSPRRPCARSA